MDFKAPVCNSYMTNLKSGKLLIRKVDLLKVLHITAFPKHSINPFSMQ